jgi:choline dehydrogenase-like flavoprotein
MATTTIPPTTHDDALGDDDRATLAAVCAAFLPRLAPGPGDDQALFALDARSLGVPAAMEVAIMRLPGGDRQQVRQLLRMLERPVFIALLVGRRQGFSDLPPTLRERALQRMAKHPAPQIRTGFQALKRLATFLFYSVIDAQGRNPAWPLLGYDPPFDPPAQGAMLRLTTIDQPRTFEADVCVIGSGAGGSVVVAELAGAGKRVVMLEAGSGDQAPDYDQREISGMQRLYLDAGMTATRDLSMVLLAGATIGGGTAINWQTSLRLPDVLREEWAARSGCRFFADESFTRAFEAVEARLNVGTDETIINANNARLRDGAEALGYRWRVLPRNTRGCDPDQCGQCVFGCRHGGKQSTAVTYLRDAQQHDVEIVVQCRAERVLIEHGRAVGVVASATDPASGRVHRVTVRAPVVIVAAGAINTPAILLRSGLTHPQLGRNLFVHPTTAVSGLYESPVEPWRGPPMSIMVDQWALLDGLYGFRLETVPAHPGLMALGTPWFSAVSHRREMQRIRHKAAIIAIVRDREGGQVRLGDGGRPVIDYRLCRSSRYLLRRAIGEAARIHLAAGATEALTLHTREQRARRGDDIDAFCDRLMRETLDYNWSTLFSAHQMGTCRMGSDPRSAVVNADGEVYGVRGLFVADGSAFPAAAGVNPMLTIMALAHHVAQRIKAR